MAEFLHATVVTHCAESVSSDDVSQTQVGGVTLSSRAVKSGDLYAALPGQRVHGADFAADAARAGAVAVLTDQDGRDRALASGLPVLLVPNPRAALGHLSAWFYGRPAERLQTLGVTGTNGKTTTTYLLDGALRRLGRHTGLIGTIALRVGDEVIPATGTTPEAPDLQALLAVMVQRHVDSCSMEISSHALDQHRVAGLTVDVAGFTNLSQDHLDHHGSMEAYFAAKALLFTPEYAHTAVICVDDDWGRRLADQVTIPIATVSSRVSPEHRDDPAGQARHWQVVESDGGALPTITVRAPDGQRVSLIPSLPGDFNVANTVLALAMLVEAGHELQAAAQALSQAESVPGRMERVVAHGSGRDAGPLAVVDYAHTPDAVAAAVRALRAGADPLVVVLGAGGDRDREKRPLMGAAAATADVVVVTDDNPRSEDPAVIRAAVLDGARRAAERTGCEVLEIADRRAAIEEAVRRGQTPTETGVILVAGKGHEGGQEVAGVVHPFDDREVLAQALTTMVGDRG